MPLRRAECDNCTKLGPDVPTSRIADRASQALAPVGHWRKFGFEGWAGTTPAAKDPGRQIVSAGEIVKAGTPITRLCFLRSTKHPLPL